MKTAWKSLGAGALLIMALTMAVYIPAMRGGFLFDDYDFITTNRLIKTSDGLYRFWCTTDAADYYPMTWSLWWLEWRLWGGNPIGYHVVNVLLHAVDAVLIWMILRRLKTPGAFVAALVFAVHPVNVASVAWISEQKNTLSMLFYVVAILLYLRFDDDNRWRWYGLSLIAFVLAALSKSAVVMLPVVLLGCAWWRRGRVRWQDLLYTIPFFILSLALGLVTVWFQYNRAMERSAARGAGFLVRLAGAGWVPWFYLYKTILPVNLTMIYPKWEIDPSRLVSYVPGAILVGGLALFWWKRQTWGRPCLFASGYFLATLFPVLGFIDQGFYRFSLVADHWQYYSIIGVIALVVAAGEKVGSRLGERRRFVAPLASAAVVAALGTAAWQRSGVYQSDEMLWRDTLAKNPRCWVAHNNLGLGLWQSGQVQEAMQHYEEALRIKPDYAETHYNLGLALGHAGKTQEEIAQYRLALRFKPEYAEAYNNLALALSQMGETPEAIADYERALQIKPDCAEAHNNLANTLAHANRVPEAIAHWERAVLIDPDFAEAHNNLALVLWQEGRTRQAIGHWEQALQTKPDYAEACNNLAWVLATHLAAETGDPAQAVTLAERACELSTNREPSYLDTLAVAYAAAGRFKEAIVTGEKAEEVARADGQPQLTEKIETRLQLYRDGRVYRETGANSSQISGRK
ncbi:MAG TPA: tetratricopeptide repeat protein [Verrucomicrobiae bacterium]|nr:tetratricopeptide repeat protein [Verrucomicrobiae bacterium]